MKVLSHLKLKYSIPKTNDPTFFAELNSKMEFHSSMKLSNENVKEDAMLKEHFKILMNCGLGKFAQKSKPLTTKFIRNQVIQTLKKVNLNFFFFTYSLFSSVTWKK